MVLHVSILETDVNPLMSTVGAALGHIPKANNVQSLYF